MTAFYTLVMTLGYTYGVCTGGVSDNILNNFGVDDMLMNTGRVGLAVTILVSFPLLTVPLIGTLVRAYREISSECGCRGTSTFLHREIRSVMFHSRGELRRASSVGLCKYCIVNHEFCYRVPLDLWALLASDPMNVPTYNDLWPPSYVARDFFTKRVPRRVFYLSGKGS